jgi:hypothetical protein
VFISNRPSLPVDLHVVSGALARRVLLGLGILWVSVYIVETHVRGVEEPSWFKEHGRSALYGLWTVESMSLDGQEIPMTDATRWRDLAIDRNPLAWSRELSGKRHYFDFKWDEASGLAQVKERGSTGDASAWTCERGVKMVKGDPPLLLRNEERGKPVDVQRKSLVIKGTWDGHDLELHTIEKVFRLQTGFRLRQELPDFW